MGPSFRTEVVCVCLCSHKEADHKLLCSRIGLLFEPLSGADEVEHGPSEIKNAEKRGLEDTSRG